MDDFDLRKIAESGQCFRWTALPDSGYRIVAGSHFVHIHPKESGVFTLDCAEEDRAYWENYFDLAVNYAAIRKMISETEDPFLYKTSQYGAGIRILRQDPFETLISFLISQRKSIPAIRTSIERLCRASGPRLGTGQDSDDEIYGFPDPEALASLSPEVLTECGLGYRVKYVAAAARAAADGELCFQELSSLPDEELTRRLLSIYGSGIKVSSCIQLFAFHRLNSFPEDVWIKRVLAEQYPSGFPFEKYNPYNGVMQQYLFYYYRSHAFSTQEKCPHQVHHQLDQRSSTT